MVFYSRRFPSLVAHGLRCASISRSASTMTPPAASKLAIASRINGGTAMRGIPEYSMLVSQRNTIWSKVWYRPDGAPRSKRKGLKVAIGLIILVVADLYAAEKFTKQARFLSTRQLQLQYLDLTRYPTVDLSVPSQTLAYYRLLYHLLTDMNPEDLDNFMAALELLLKLNKEAYTIVRTTCEDVHRICAEMYGLHAQDDIFKAQLNGDRAYVEYTLRVLKSTVQLVEAAQELAQKAENKQQMQLIEQLSKTPPTTTPEDFSVVG